MLTELDVLTLARTRLASRDNWMQGAMTDGGRACAQGTLYMVSAGIPSRIPAIQAALTRLRHVAREMGYPRIDSIWKVNDRGGHRAVLEMYDRAIEAARQERDVRIALEAPSDLVAC